MSDLAQLTKVNDSKADIVAYINDLTVGNSLQVGGTAIVGNQTIAGNLTVDENLSVGNSATVNNLYSTGDSYFDNNIYVDGLINSQLSSGNVPSPGTNITLQGQALRLTGYTAPASGLEGFTIINNLIGTSIAILSSFESADANAYNIVLYTNIVSDGALAVKVYNGYTSPITIDIMIYIVIGS